TRGADSPRGYRRPPSSQNVPIRRPYGAETLLECSPPADRCHPTWLVFRRVLSLIRIVRRESQRSSRRDHSQSPQDRMLALYFHSSERGPHSSFAARQTPVGTTIEWHKRKAAGEPQDATCCV